MAGTIYNSNIYAAGNPAKYGVYPSWVFGYVSVGTGVTITTDDTINLCLIPANTMLVGQFVLDFPALDSGGNLTIKLQDNSSSTSGGVLPAGTTASTTPIVYIASAQTTMSTNVKAGGIVTGAALSAGVLGTSYASQQILQLIPAVSGSVGTSGAVQINFMFAFQPL